jgi:hypothetical protein
MADQMTLEQFGQSVKKKYPQYAGLSDTDIANKVIAKYPQYKSAIKVDGGISEQDGPGLRDTVLNVFRPLSSDERGGIESKIGKYAGAAVEGVANTAMGITAGVGQMVLHPLSSIYASAQTAADALNQMFPDVGLNPQQKAAKEASLQRLKTQWEQIKDNPDYAIGNLAGSIEGGKIIGEFGGKMTGKLRDTANAARELPMRLATKTGPSFTREVVRDTIKKNEKIAGKNELAKDAAVDKNAENAAAHQEKVQTALHDTKGNEISHEQALKAKAEEIRTREATEAAKAKHDLEAERVKVRKANEEARKVAADKNAKAQTEHAAKVAEHQKLTDATNRLNENDRTFKTQLKETENRVHAEANQMYEDLKPKLNPVEADPETVSQIVENAIGEFDRADSEPPLLTKLRKASENGVLTYEDLDGFRSQIGREMRRGTLPGSVYHIYDTLLNGLEGEKTPGIIDEMSRIAESKGMAKQANAARSAWRNWAKAFRDPKSPLKRILDDPEPHGMLHRVRTKEVSGVGAIRQFNPQLADAVQSGLDLMDELRMPRKASPFMPPADPGAAPEPIPPKLQPEPTAPPQRLTAGSPEERAAQEVKAPERVPIPDRPPEVTPKLKPNEVVTPKSLIEAKRAHAIEWASSIRNSSQHLATVFVALDAARKVLSGRLFGFGTDVAARAGYAAAKDLWANYLESEKVLDAVGKITEKDVKEIMKLPEDQRQGFDQLVLHAQSRGTKLKPGVLGAMFGVTTPPITIGSKTKELKALRDAGHYTDNSSQ